MAKLVLQDLTSGYASSTKYNANNTLIEEALDNTLSRDGSTPNEMEANIDMNSNRIINLGAPQANTDAARWVDVTDPSDLTLAPSPIGSDGLVLGSDGTDYVFRGVFQETAEETAAGASVADTSLPPGDMDRYSTVANAVAVCESFLYKLHINSGSHTVGATLTVDTGIYMSGDGCNVGITAGSILSNTGANVNTILLDDSGTDTAQRSKFENFGIIHQAAGFSAIKVFKAPYTFFDNVTVKCNSLGLGGVELGDDVAATTARAYQATLNNVRVDDAVSYGIRVNTTGHTIELRNCSPRSSVNGAHGAYINTRNVHIYGGQYGANNTGGINIYFYNVDSQGHHRGSVNDVVFEGVAVGEYAVVIDGATNSFSSIELNRLGIQLSTNLGTLCKFGRATDCVLNFPSILSPTGGGIACEWTANSNRCIFRVDKDGATAPIVVNASATGAVKEVYGQVAQASVSGITTAANLQTVLVEGITELPGFTPVHNGVAWNVWFVTIADDGVATYTPPTTRSIVEVISDGGVTFAGRAFARTDASAAASAQGIGADFEVNTTAGTLVGTTGTDAKVTLRANTNGLIYLENRSGASRDFTVLFRNTAFGF